MSKAIVSFFDSFPEYNGRKIQIRGTDGYVSVKDISAAINKRFNNWTRTQFAKDFLEELSLLHDLPIDHEDPRSSKETPLIDYVRGGQEGVFLHPSVAIGYFSKVPPSGSMKSPQFVYLIEAGNKEFLKIGTSFDPKVRLRSLQSGNPLELNLICVIEGDEALESQLLLKFAEQKVRGEWFAYSAAIVDEFEKLRKKAKQNKNKADSPLNNGNPCMAATIFTHALQRCQTQYSSRELSLGSLTQDEFTRGLEFNREDITDMYG